MIFEESTIKEYIRSGFAGIYLTSLVSAPIIYNLNYQWQPRLSKEEKQSISGGVTDEEIKATLWSLKPFKAPGPDGLHAGFFQRFWVVVGSSVMEEIKLIFADPHCFNSKDPRSGDTG